MKLKTACIIAMIMTFASILMNIAGHGIFHALRFGYGIHLFNSTVLIYSVIPILNFLVSTGGFILLLLGIIIRLNNPNAKIQTLFILAGILVLLGSLMAIPMAVSQLPGIYQNLSFTRFIYHTSMYIISFISSVCMGIFILTQAIKINSGKPLAAVILALNIVLFTGMFTENVIDYQNHFITMQTVGSITMYLGHFFAYIAAIIFLIMFLEHRPRLPMAEIVTPSPEPIPTLSAEELPPKHETN